VISATDDIADAVIDQRPEPPILLSQEQLDAHAAALAATHQLAPDSSRPRPLLPILDEGAQLLDEAYDFLSAAARTAQPIPSEDWLRDNHHVVQDQVRAVRQDLPRRYYTQLPKLANGEFAGYPRVYSLARDLVLHTAGRFDLQTLIGYVAAYQRGAALNIGELWAIPIMLRVALVDELRRRAEDVLEASRNREEARRWGLRIAEATAEPGKPAADPARMIEELLRSTANQHHHLPPAFVVELLQWLRDQPSTAAPAWQALHRELEVQGDSPEAILRREHQREAANQLAIGNIITTMRLVSASDWPVFVERVSIVERILQQDPAGAYARMDFPTRDRYRHSVEQLARGAKKPEPAVAERAVALAREGREADPRNDRRHHVGYYLISRGRFRLEQDLGYPPTAGERIARFLFRHPAIGYLGAIAAAVGLILASFLSYAARRGAGWPEIVVVALVVLIPVSELAINLLNLLITTHVPPRQLPKFDMRAGIPTGDRTMVVVPAIIDTEEHVNTLIDDLEVRFFANRDPGLHFALLSDFPDSLEPTAPGDDELLAKARAAIDRLNASHGDDRFFLFHRERRWNEGERCWMGWERKRGKLHEFNRLLRGATETSFVVQLGDLSLLPGVRYVITLDSDTQLPLEAGRAMVGTLSHPLNRPRFDAGVRRVTEGYGILQPRVAVSVVSANRTRFSRIFSGHVGIDPYTTAVSDVYQDLFHEGSYVGKGIYEVDAFEASLDSRVPANSLLSHDLFEGSFARAALCTDIHVIDDYPFHYLNFAARQHRWVRGDWQIARWIWRTVPDAGGRAVPNRLPVIARWKILDNLRRSLVPPALVLMLTGAWTFLPGSPALWTTLALLVIAFPAYTQLGRSVTGRVAGVPLREHFRAERDNILGGLRQGALSLVMLAHQMALMLDAIFRALIRMLVTRRRLLEWVTADRAVVPAALGGVIRRMWIAPAIALTLALVVAVIAPGRLVLAAPVLALWFLSPLLAHITGLPLEHRHPPLTREQRAALRRVARRTWRFFEELLTPADNWLIPDNYQEDRPDVIAHRTSPTNIGLQLLAVLAARDFGYLSASDVVDRLEPTFDTLLRMQRYRGHFYNWYDTRSLVPLAPPYISTVDSGNLAGYLLALRSGLGEMTESTPLIDAGALEGLEDMLGLLEAEVTSGNRGAERARLDAQVQELRTLIAARPVALTEWRTLLGDVRERLTSLALLLHELEEPSGADAGSLVSHVTTWNEAGYWLERAEAAVAGRHAELERLTGWMTVLGPKADSLPAHVPSPCELIEWCGLALDGMTSSPHGSRLRTLIEEARRHAEDLVERADRLAAHADDLLEEIEFGFLFNPERQLFSIGFSVYDGRLDNSYYDILASEARLASYVAIALGKVSHEHWFKLGRSLTPTGSSRALLSWSASMFEYLMPLLVMRSHAGTLLDETYEAVVRRQMDYAVGRSVPWGISESAYNVRDLEGNYQYRAFGVPGLGLKRGLADDLVIAPYATLLAAPVAPRAVLANLERLRAQGLSGRFGYFEAIDYTPERVPPDVKGGVVLVTYMAHHQGMGLLALDNLINDGPMQRRFHADPRMEAAELLLQERIPRLVPLKNPPIERAEHVPMSRGAVAPAVRRYVTPHTLSPRAHLLSNGSYSVMVTNAGGGYSRRQNLAMTRWREDITTDHWGTFCFVRDLESGTVWSTTHQPAGGDPDEFEVTFALDRAVFRRVDGHLETRTEIVVSSEDDVELRRISITNHGTGARSLDLTSYAEVVLAPPEADLAHPAFSNLFVETSALPERDALLCARRPRAGGNRTYLLHMLSGRGRVGPATQWETNRARFIGRGRTLANPLALASDEPLSNSTGPVLDPVVSLRQFLRLPPGGTARIAFITGFAESETEARRLAEKYHDRRAVARALALAGTHSQIELRHFGLTVEDTIRFQRLGSRVLYGDPRLRALDTVQGNRRGQPELWKYGISGDLPIVVARFSEGGELPLFRDLLKAHEYLRAKGLTFDLVVLNEHGASYRQDLHDALHEILQSSPEHGWADKPGGVFLRRTDVMPLEDQTLLKAAARAVMDGSQGGLYQQLVRPLPPVEAMPPALSTVVKPLGMSPASSPGSGTPQSFNGLGGFAKDGREYVMQVHPAAGGIAPAPWSNVVAHEAFGFVATDLGPGFTWSENSHDNRLSPWQNDPVCDPPGEAIFLRDDEDGRVWSATPLPAGGGQPYTVRHGQGYSIFEHDRNDIASRLRLFVPRGEQVKIFELGVRNRSSRARRLSVTIFVDWTLGEHRSRTRLHIVTSREPATGAVLATNAFRDPFGDRVAFVDLHDGSPGRPQLAARGPRPAVATAERSVTGDRSEFIGRNGSLGSPAALLRARLSDRTGAGLDPCGAVQLTITLGPGEERTLIGQLGEAIDEAAARAILQRFRAPEAASAAAAGSIGFWNSVLETIQVKTPEPSMDLLLNRWLLYQALSCRIWGRSAFYQSSGAFGFRDQLQDSLALLHSTPDLVRAQLLRAASRQFVEGDVQHWWHEPGGQGVRTRFSDDRLWLVFCTLLYVSATADDRVWDEQVPFLEGRLLDDNEHEAYERPSVSSQSGSLYEHCVRAIAVSLGTGAHGLPLIGIGDWNDGMSMVGAGGRGESVWLGWFLISVLRPFADVAEARGEADRARGYRVHAGKLTQALDDAWDGEWYRRAYFDDGTPLGSKENTECRIDSIAQSWAVISGAGKPDRARQAMASTDRHLVREDAGLILLLTPPFDKMTPSPGYIQGYVPGVRENGGQYTHAALWTVLAHALLDDGDRAEALFRIINPINHAADPESVERYRVEPYVVAADVYSQDRHVGRGGWTWYTGSAGWMYRVGVEAILGVTLHRGALRIDPCIPRGWKGYQITYRTDTAELHINVENPEGVSRGVRRVEVDGVEQADLLIPLKGVSGVHSVRVILGPRAER
jgi:cyclic beta-1,2-glucan synthetase